MSKLNWRRRPSPAFVLAFIALLGVLGGVGYAAKKLPKNSVGAKQIKNESVSDAEVKDGSLGSGEIKDGSLGAADLAPGQLPTVAAVFRDEAVDVASTTLETPTPIATLTDLPAGAYAITAKTVGNSPGGPDNAPNIHCQLQAPAGGGPGSDVDLSIAEVLSNSPYVLAMQVVHRFPADGGQVRVACSREPGDDPANVALTKIQAIRVGGVTNASVSG